jgi:hypothetical protein
MGANMSYLLDIAEGVAIAAFLLVLVLGTGFAAGAI